MAGRERVVLPALAVLLVAAGMCICFFGEEEPGYEDTAYVPPSPGSEPWPGQTQQLIRSDGAGGAGAGNGPERGLRNGEGASGGDGSRTTLATTRAWTLRCSVLKGMEDPFPGARVRFKMFAGADSEGKPLQHMVVTADENGEATWHPQAPDQTVTVEVAGAEPDTAGRKRSRLVPVGEAPPDFKVHLFPLDHELHGLVTAEQDRPVAGARVCWRVSEPPVYSDKKGRFRMRVSSAYPRLRYYVVAPGHARFKETLSLDGPGKTEVRVRLEPGFRVYGRVTDEHARPIEGAEVSTFWANLTGERTTTDEQGNYELDTLIRGSRTRHVRAKKKGYAQAHGQTKEDGVEARVNLVLKSTGTVLGVVYGPDGKPVSDVQVGISRGGRPGPKRSEVTAPDGSFRLQNVTPGESFLWAWRQGSAVGRQEIQVPGDGTTLHVEVRLRRGHAAAGRVVDGDGKPVPNARVSPMLKPWHRLRVDATADEDGRFRLQDLPAGPLFVSVYAKGFVYLNRKELRVGDTNIEIVLQRSVTLRGRVVDGQTGAPVKDFRIRFVKGRVGIPGSWYGAGQRFQNTDGYWETKGARIPPGTSLDLEARAEGYAPTVLKDVTATAGLAPDALTFRMVPGVALRGQVLDRGTGRPMAARSVTLVHPGRTAWNPRATSVDTVRTDGNGSFEFSNVAAGTVHLKVARRKGPPFLHGPIQVPASGIMDHLIVSVGRVGSIEGLLRNTEGMPLPNVKVTLRPGPMARQLRLRSQSSVTDSTGRFRFESVANTEYVLTASGEGSDGVTSVYRTTVMVKGDGPTKVELAMTGKCSLRGSVRIARHDGSDVFVRLYRKTGLKGAARWGQPFRAQVRAGTFSIRGLPEGAYDIYVYYKVMGSRRGQAGPKNVKVRPGVDNSVEVDITPK